MQCEICGREFQWIVKNRTTCSPRCRNIQRYRNNREEILKRRRLTYEEDNIRRRIKYAEKKRQKKINKKIDTGERMHDEIPMNP